MSNCYNVEETNIPFTPFDCTYVGSMQAASIGKSFLRKSGLESQRANLLTEYQL